ncbi:MAG TPA: hypothetical protein VGB55_04585 [Tepidisphaeraceae bacterium]|jgi:hypothetical protein
MPFTFFHTVQSSSQFGGMKFGLLGLPRWARGLLLILTIPGILLMGLSILMIGVSLLALLLPTVPVYFLLKKMMGSGGGAVEYGSPGSKRVEAVVRDAQPL